MQRYFIILRTTKLLDQPQTKSGKVSKPVSDSSTCLARRQQFVDCVGVQERCARVAMHLAVLLCHLCAIHATSALGADIAQFPMHGHGDHDIPRPFLEFSEEWEILGPFRIGTRGIRDQIKLCRAPGLTKARRGRMGS